MAVYKRGYQRYDGPRTSHWSRVMAFPRHAWKRLFQQRLVLILMVLSLFWPLMCALFIYVSNHSELWSGLGSGFARMLEIDGSFFLLFLRVQASFAILLAAFAGPGLVAPDLAHNALPLYFSRPLSRVDYVLARLIVLAGMLSLVTWVPGVLLVGMQSGMAGWSWLWHHWRLGVGVAAGFAVWILLVSLVALACSAYVKWRIVSGALILGFFFVLAGVAEMFRAVLRADWGYVLNPAKAMDSIWRVMMGVEISNGPAALDSVVMMAVLVGMLLWLLERKLRAVEVVS
jgi:ABC-2 type transport system permease protein